MPIYEYRCTECDTEYEELVKMDSPYVPPCPFCDGKSRKVVLHAPKIDWGAMGAQKNAGPEFIDRFEKVHKEERAREEKLAKGE